MATFCPITGSNIYTRSEWTDQRVSDSLTTSFWVIGENIIYSRPIGRPSVESAKASLAINEQVADYISKNSGCSSHIQIEDYGQVSGSDAETRRLFVSAINNRDGLSAVIFCNLSIALSIAVNIGSRMNVKTKSVHVVKHYKEAVQIALEKSSVTRANGGPPINLSGLVCEQETSLRPVEVRMGDAFNLNVPGLELDGMLIDHTILHATTRGYLESRHITPLDDYHRQAGTLIGDEHQLEYIVVNLEAVEGTTHSARIEYMRSLRRWHQHSQFRVYIGYSAKAAQRTALLITKALMPFKVRVAKDLPHALALVCEDKLQGEIDTGSVERTGGGPQVVKPEDLEDFLAYIGRINWESQGLDDHYNIEVDHPFYVLYQSVKLIKEEIDTLFDERKRFEEQLYQARKMESVGTFAAGIAHDINNILCIISGNMQLALSEMNPESSAHAYLTDAKIAAGRAESVVKQILDFSRTSDRNYEPLDAVSVLRDALQLLRASIPATIDIKERFPGVPINIRSDSTQLSQILMNLFANAAQAMEETGGTLEVCISKEFVMDAMTGHTPHSRAGEYLKLIVSDTGPGISADHIDRIFDPYFTTKEIGRGSGMGLAVVLGIVKMHGGTITVNSEPQNGTTFTMLFPIVHEQPNVAVELPSALPRGTETILVVEDEEAIITLMRNMLGRLGYRVDANSDPVAAFEHFRSSCDQYDLVISDMTMPTMTGVELAAKVKTIRADIPVVICTGYSPLIDDEKAAKLGISALVMKPLEMRELANIVRGVLDEGERSVANL